MCKPVTIKEHKKEKKNANKRKKECQRQTMCKPVTKIKQTKSTDLSKILKQ
jgi:hypothetical protein